MSEGVGDENLGSFGDRKRREMIERLEDRKRRREVADVQPVNMEVEHSVEVKPESVPAEVEVLQPTASPPTSPSVSHSDSSDTEDLPMSTIEEIAERVQ